MNNKTNNTAIATITTKTAAGHIKRGMKVVIKGLWWEVTHQGWIPNTSLVKIELERGMGGSAKKETFKVPTTRIFNVKKK